ncbi:hypothetical protein Tco_0171180, partial [Tanacetum coccineum]
KLLTKDRVILEEPASSTGTLSSLQNLDKDLIFTDQFFMQKTQEEEPGKTNVEAESQSDSSLLTSTTTISTITTTTTPLPQPPQQQQSTVDLILVKHIDRFKDLPTVDMKEILQQWMFEDNSYQAHDVHNDLYEAQQKSLELDYSNQRLAN